MKKKLLSLLTLLLAVCSGAWASYSVTTSDGKVTATWDFAEYTSPNNKSIATGETVEYQGLTFYGGGGGNAETVDNNGFRFQGKTQQWNSVWGRYISYTPSYDGTLKVTVKKGGSSGTRYVNITNALVAPATSVSENVLAVQEATSTSSTNDCSYNVTAGTTYYIEADNGIYATKVTFVFNVASAVAPTISPNGGDIDGGDAVKLSGLAVNTYYQWSETAQVLTSASEGWTEGAATVAPNVTGTRYLYAYASNGSGYESSVVSATYNVTYATPTVTSPTLTGGGFFTGSKSVTITKTDDESTLKYSYDNSTWDDYTAALSITETTTVYAKAVRSGYEDSPVVSAKYIIQDAGSTGTVSDLVAISAPYTFIAEEIKPAATSLYKSSRIYTQVANATKIDKGSVEIDGVSHYNYVRMRSNASENLVFKVSAPCILTVYSQSVSADNFHIGTTSAGTDIASTRQTTSATSEWSCIIPTAGLVYITGNANNDFCIAGFKLTALPTFQLNASGYGTFSYGQDVEILSGAKAYTATLDYANSTITCAEITSKKIPAGKGVLLYGEANATVSIKTAFDAEALAANNLHGTTNASGALVAMGSNNYFVLSGNTFKKFTGAAFSDYKAYFEVDGDDAVLAREWVIDWGSDNDVTSIMGVANSQEQIANGQYYDLQGRRVAQPTKGLYIVNGKKVIVK